MNTDKTERTELTIWGAVGPNGQLVKSSVGTFKAVAARWALRRGNYEVVKLGTIPSPHTVEKEPVVVKEHEAPQASTFTAETEVPRRGRGRPRKVDTTPKYLEIDRSFFGRHKK